MEEEISYICRLSKGEKTPGFEERNGQYGIETGTYETMNSLRCEQNK